MKVKPYLFMLTHDVSYIPMSMSTPSRMSLITSGGARSDLISDRLSVLMLPTAERASWNIPSDNSAVTSQCHNHTTVMSGYHGKTWSDTTAFQYLIYLVLSCVAFNTA